MTVSRFSRSGGFSLIELLVAVLVMGIGVLGATALQMVSLQNNRAALERGEAVQLAEDIIDRNRTNPGQSYSIDMDDGPPAAPDCLDADCNSGEMADFDLASWKCSLGSYRDDDVCTDLRDSGALPAADLQPGLPNGDGSIEWDAGLMRVTVEWTGMDEEVMSVEVESQL